jgi:hypothetical protein
VVELSYATRTMRTRLVPLLFLLSTAASAAPPPIEIDAPFPDVGLPNLEGQPRSIAHFRGQKVILQIFASW